MMYPSLRLACPGAKLKTAKNYGSFDNAQNAAVPALCGAHLMGTGH
jgi:hypothetical protein